MPKSQPSPHKKKQKAAKKRKKSHVKGPKEELYNVCHITGLDDGVSGSDVANSGASSNNAFGFGGTGGGGDDDNVMDCLDELAFAQTAGTMPSSSSSDDAVEIGQTSPPRIPTASDSQSPPSSSSTPPPLPPPGLHRIPNLRIELARHLQTQNLSAFLLGACPGLRMPSFERWLLDSKLEEGDRLQRILEGWAEDPSSKLSASRAAGGGDGRMKKKKKYGRAAIYERKKKTDEQQDARNERENSRREKDCKLLLEADKRIPAGTGPGRIGSCIREVGRDPILPYHAMEWDPSCDRLVKEIVAAMMSADHASGEESEERQLLRKGKETVRDLCHRTAEACKELAHLEHRLGKFQKFSWDATAAKKKRKRGGGGGGGNVDKVLVEWQSGDASGETPARGRDTCSLVYIAKRRKTSRPAGLVGVGGHAAVADVGDETQRKPKPFVIKMNAPHYRKLRAAFDAAYDSSSGAPSATKEQSAHAFHALAFALALRYSSLSGGQQLNDFRGGGMQGAVHDGVFDCLSKWFGGFGTECFASPFNSALPRFFSAFPSPDVDGHFGSRGDFFRPSEESDLLRPGWYELNPPFSPAVMDKMAERIGELLETQCERGSDATFVVVIPTVHGATDENGPPGEKARAKKRKRRKEESKSTNLVSAAASKSFRRLIDSPHCKSHIVLPAREHGYVEGGQHLRPTKYKESQYSTSVIVLGSKGWLGGDDAASFEKELRDAFASRHAKEVEERKEKSDS